MHTGEEMAHIQARFGGPLTRRFGTSRHCLLESVQLRLQIVTEHRALKTLQGLLDAISEIFMDVIVALAHMRQESLSTLTHMLHTIALRLREAGHGSLKEVEFGRQILFEIVQRHLLMGDL